MAKQDSFKEPPFSLRNRLGRLLWNFVYLLLFRYTPRPLHAWRAFLLRCFGATIGYDAHIYGDVKIWAPWNLNIGDECGVGNGVNLYSQGKITMGKRAVISQGAYICTGTHDYTQAGYPLITMPITIGDHAWVAAEVFVHPGVNIGTGCVVGARSVVVKDLPDWMVCAGNPCKPLKKRVFTE